MLSVPSERKCRLDVKEACLLSLADPSGADCAMFDVLPQTIWDNGYVEMACSKSS